jgi:hypothetical protein
VVGYSGTGTAKKLGLKAGMTLVVVDAPPGWTVAELPPDVEVVRRVVGDDRTLPDPAVVVAFHRCAADFDAGIAGLARLVWPSSALWAAWPRRAGGHQSDLTDTVVREGALALGLVDNKVAAIDNDWSGLRFVWRKERRERPPPDSDPS